MGTMIEEEFKVLQDEYTHLMGKYQLMQADYVNRLKADMVAMLTEIQLEIEEQKFDVHIDKDVWNDAIRVCSELIRQRINELKGKV